jgi:NADPH2:quinone reductase
LTRTVGYGGNIASIGLAAGFELSTTVLPFILRAVCLLGINSVDTPRDLRLAVWQRIGGDLRPQHLDKIAGKTIRFDELPKSFSAYIDGSVVGRTVVAISEESAQ